MVKGRADKSVGQDIDEELHVVVDDRYGEIAAELPEDLAVYRDEYQQAVAGSLAYLKQGRSSLQSFMLVMGLINGVVASYQSLSFGSRFVKRVMGPDEANAPAVGAVLAPVSGMAAFLANAMIPVISSDIAAIATFNMFCCIAVGGLNLLTGFQSSALRKVSKRNEWYDVGAVGYSLLVLGLGCVGSIANTEAAKDSVDDKAAWMMLAVTIANGIVQVLQNSRSVMLLLSKDRAYLKRHRLHKLNNLLPESERQSEQTVHRMSYGSPHRIGMPIQVGLLLMGVVSASLYNATAAVLPIERDNAGWTPMLRHGVAGINFVVKTILLMRATSAQSRRILQSRDCTAVKGIGFALLGIFGLLSVSGAAEYPKKYLFDDDNNFGNSLISIFISAFACVALNAGDMYDAGRIIYNYVVNKFLLQTLCGRPANDKQAQAAATYKGMVSAMMDKAMREDESDVFHHRSYTPDHECKRVDEYAEEVTEQPRSIAMTAMDLQPDCASTAANGYQRMGAAVTHHVKPKAVATMKSWQQLTGIRQRLYQAKFDALAAGTVDRERQAQQYADASMEALHRSCVPAAGAAG